MKHIYYVYSVTMEPIDNHHLQFARLKSTKFCYVYIKTSVIFFFQHTKRTGWLIRNVNDCETVAGHMYRMSIMTFLLDGQNGLDRIKCMELGKTLAYISAVVKCSIFEINRMTNQDVTFAALIFLISL